MTEPEATPDPRAEFRAYLATAVMRLAPRSRQLMVIGLITIVLGMAVIGIVTQSRVLSLIPAGVLMAIAAVLELGIGHNARGDDTRTTPWARAGLLHVAAAVAAIASSFLPFQLFSGFIGLMILAAGIVHLRTDFALPVNGKTAIMPMASIVTTLIGLLILTQWPAGDLQVLGVLIGVDLIVRGWAWVGFGVTLRKAMNRS
ncbi:hypothetical protein PY365_21060 [Roseiarcaceae bacterium H3SJ34-1]|uniref:hypothetical protein n=1 Tax=Terripilifer ovatus TaxID=3032367 RepID=UPI003AB961EF|nr:hypothetical protein [Roseiarcaceae bacterium H3SJ34-1]